MERQLGKSTLEDDARRLLTWIRQEAGGLTHNILSATHPDTIAGTVTRGDLVVGESTPKWKRLALGTANYVVGSDGSDVVYLNPVLTLPLAPVAQNDLIIANATPAWSILTGPSAQYQRLSSGASPFVPVWTLNLEMADDAWIGLGAAAGRIIFDSTPNPDQAQLAAADLYLPASHGIIHADGVAAGHVLRADGTRYVPADPTTTVPLAPVAQGDLIIANGTPAWSILTLAAGAGYALVSTATTAAWSQTPTWTGKHTFTAASAIEIDVASGDPVIIFDTAGADRFTIGVDDDDADQFKISSGGSLGAGFDWIQVGWDGHVGIRCTANANLEIEDGGTDKTVLLKVTQDDANTYGIVIGNDTWDVTDTHGLGMALRNSGTGYIWVMGTAAEHLILQPDGFASNVGNVGIGLTDASPPPAAKLDVYNFAGSGQEVLKLSQNDADDEFIHFLGESADESLTYSFVEEGDQTSSTLAGWFKILVTDNGDQIADQAYYVPFYTLA